MFQLEKRLPKKRQRFVKKGLKRPIFFGQKTQFRVHWTYDFVQISLACGRLQTFLRNV